MGIGFLDLLVLIVILTGLTQVLLPFILPSKLQYFWFFRKNRGIDGKIKEVVAKSDKLKEEKKELEEEIENLLTKTKDFNQKLNK